MRGQLVELAEQLKGVHATIEQKSQEYFGELRVLEVEKSTGSERVQEQMHAQRAFEADVE